MDHRSFQFQRQTGLARQSPDQFIDLIRLAIRKLRRARLKFEETQLFATAHRSPFVDRFRADQADALVESGAPGARHMYEALLASPAPLPGGRPRLP